MFTQLSTTDDSSLFEQMSAKRGIEKFEQQAIGGSTDRIYADSGYECLQLH